MNKVIKNNDGVAIVEGTPAASLVKDVDKFFATKPPERMAGEAIKPQKLSTESLGAERLGAERLTKPSEEPMPVLETLREGSKFAEPAIKTNQEEKTPQEKEMKREEAVNKTKEFKRLRFAERSAEEQEATKGAFISTLQT